MMNWGQWEEVVCEDEDLEILAGTSEGVKVFRNNLYQVIVRSLMPKGDCVEQLPEMIWLSIKSIDQSATHDWRHFQRIKNELVGPECEGVELYPAESRMVDTSNQYHLFVMKDSKMTFPFGFRERLVLDDGEICQSLGAKQRSFEKGWPVSFTDTSLVIDKLKDIRRSYEEKKEED